MTIDLDDLEAVRAHDPGGMLAAGDPLPRATVFAAPGDGLSLHDVAAGHPALFLFYLFDFSAT